MAVCHRHGTRAAARGRRILRPGRRAGSSRRGVAVPRFRADQEPSSGSVDRAGGVDGQPRRARVRPLRTPRTRRSAHREHGQGHRRDAQGRHAATVRRGIAIRVTATANTPMARHSTGPASAAPGHSSPASAPTTSWRPDARARPNNWRRRSRHSLATAGCFRSRSGTAPIFLSGSCSSGTRPARRCRSCGRTPST